MDWSVDHITNILKENCKNNKKLEKFLVELFLFETENHESYSRWTNGYKSIIKKYIEPAGK